MRKITLSILAFQCMWFAFSQGLPIREETKLDQVYAQYNLTGEDVLFIMIDRGIDYSHPDFLDENGNTRVAYIYDMIDPTGANAPNNPYGVGTIFDATQINNALDNNDPPLSTDRYGHGTATTGIAAGNGTGTVSNEFQGVAPKATIISIKITHDPFPAFGAEPGQSGFFDASYIEIALNFAADKIAELGLPAVTLMNIGSIGGPTDGTSNICRAIDAFINDGHVFVLGVGDDGGVANHASHTLTQGQTIELEINKAEAGNLRFDLWYSEGDRFTITLERPNGTTEGPFAAPTNPTDFVHQLLGDMNMFHQGAAVDYFEATSNKRELLIDFTGATGVYKVIINAETVSNGHFNATLNPARIYNNNRFLSFQVPGYSVADYAASFNGITPTDYVINNSWVDINGITQSISNQGNPGEIWTGSSMGPTHDGRLAVDFAVPGEVAYAAYADKTYYEFFDFNVLQNSNGLYGIQNAVSAAAPVAAGIIALMLEVNPDLTHAEIKTLLRNASNQDSFTGNVPNETWGYGKLNALEVIEDTFATLGVTEFTTPEIKLFPNPSQDVLHIKSNVSLITLTIFNVAGKRMMRVPVQTASNSNHITLNISSLPEGLYFINIQSTDNNTQTHRFIKK